MEAYLQSMTKVLPVTNGFPRNHVDHIFLFSWIVSNSGEGGGPEEKKTGCSPSKQPRERLYGEAQSTDSILEALADVCYAIVF